MTEHGNDAPRPRCSRTDAKVGCCGFPCAQAAYWDAFRVVEVQKTFYEPPRVETLAGWRARAHVDSEFTVKAWQLITHEAGSPTYRRLKTPIPPSAEGRYGSFKPTDEVLEAWEKTREAARTLRARVIVFQCPPRFLPDRRNIANLDRFFSRIPREGFVFAWEPRGSWSEGDIAPLCRGLDLVHVVDPFAARPCAGALRYYRSHGVGGYRYRYTAGELERLRGLLEPGVETYLMFNNTFMAENAREMAALLA